MISTTAATPFTLPRGTALRNLPHHEFKAPRQRHTSESEINGQQREQKNFKRKHQRFTGKNNKHNTRNNNKSNSNNSRIQNQLTENDKRQNSNNPASRKVSRPSKKQPHDAASSQTLSPNNNSTDLRYVGLLDDSDPQQAHKIKQRQKMIAKGKNTVGYARYRAEVPLEERKSRSMVTPSTPNPYLRISTKRWQGLVRAWRIALHQYDPPELVQELQPPPDLMANNADATDNDEHGNEVGEEEASTDAAIESVVNLVACQGPSQCKSVEEVTFTSSGITIYDAVQAADEVALVASRASLPLAAVKTDVAHHDLDGLYGEETSGIEALNRYDEEEIEFFHESSHNNFAAVSVCWPGMETCADIGSWLEQVHRANITHAKPYAKLSTGATCWANVSSDDENDLY